MSTRTKYFGTCRTLVELQIARCNVAWRCVRMLHADEIWSVLHRYMKPGVWTSVPEIYALVNGTSTSMSTISDPQHPVTVTSGGGATFGMYYSG